MGKRTVYDPSSTSYEARHEAWYEASSTGAGERR